MPDLRDRVEREVDFFGQGYNPRVKLDTALAHMHEGIGRQRRREVIGAAMIHASGKRVLEIGCQEWESCLFSYGYRPSELICINISEAELELGRARAARLQFACEFRNMDAHQLEFAGESFDMVFGMAILHHLEFPRALREIHRVLQTGGKILFIEPLRHNPVARLVRWLTPHARTPDELPLGRPELRLVSRNFDVENYYSEMFTVLGAIIGQRVFKNPVNPVTKLCDFVDDRLVRLVPASGAYYRSVVIRGTKPAGAWRD
jgi:ubiquinone/menaquinone biosynthesis C-methylase UbiE